jgi:hypothetical protein
MMIRISPMSTTLMLVTLLACASTATAPVNEDFTLAVGESVAVQGTPMTIRFLGVPEDSRCPINALCIWAGNARVELELRGLDAPATVSVNSFNGAKEVVYGSYRIGLVQLLPVPTTNGPIQPRDYRATLRVVPVGNICTEEARPALVVGITDSLSPSTQTFTNVSVVARDGTYRDSVFRATHPTPPNGNQIALAYERAGTYEVTVRADGYRPWARTGIVAQRDRCHVVTVPIAARLSRGQTP